MKILMACIPALSRFEILATLAGGCKKSNHDIRFIAPKDFSNQIQMFGFKTIIAGYELKELQTLSTKLFIHEQKNDLSDQAAFMFTQLAPEKVLSDILPQIHLWKPDLIIHEEGEFSAPLLAFLLQIPCVTVCWPVALKPIKVVNSLTKMLDELWIRHTKTTQPLAGLYTNTIMTCPPSLQTKNLNYIRAGMVMKPELLQHKTISNTSDFSIFRNKGKKKIHITLGTIGMYNDSIELLFSIVNALNEESLEIILSTGKSIAPQKFSKFKHVTAREFIPHHQLLPYCDAMVTHGGAGSTIASLIHGLPLLILPQGGASQLRNAKYCTEIGVALSLEKEEINNCTIRNALLSILEQKRFTESATIISKEIENMPSKESIIMKMENLF